MICIARATPHKILTYLGILFKSLNSFIILINNIRNLAQKYKEEIQQKLPKIYSQDLINNLFKNPYIKIDFLQNYLQVSYFTARKYLELLAENGFLDKIQIGKSNFYINQPLIDILME